MLTVEPIFGLRFRLVVGLLAQPVYCGGAPTTEARAA